MNLEARECRLIKRSVIQNTSPSTFQPLPESILSTPVWGGRVCKLRNIDVYNQVHLVSPRSIMPLEGAAKRHHLLCMESVAGSGITTATTTMVLPYSGHKQRALIQSHVDQKTHFSGQSWNIGSPRRQPPNKTVAGKHGRSSQTWSCHTPVK